MKQFKPSKKTSPTGMFSAMAISDVADVSKSKISKHLCKKNHTFKVSKYSMTCSKCGFSQSRV